MKHLIEIDDRTKAGETLLNLAEILSKENKGIDLLRHEIIEEEDDPEFLAKIEEGLKSGTVSKEVVMETLNNILSR